MEIDSIIYSPLVEDEEDTSGWFKSTIDWVQHNKSKTFNSIRGIARSVCNVQHADIEDIYTELLKYLYQYDDYNINSALERSTTGSIVSLEGYIHSLIKYCTLRYLTENYKKTKENIGEIDISSDGEEVSIFDTIGDKKQSEAYLNIMYDLDDVCLYHQSDRYKYGPDIYQIWYVRLLTSKYKKETKFNDILDLLGINKKELEGIEKQDIDSPMMEIAKSITLLNIDDAISIIKKYTYSSKTLEKVVAAI